MIPVDLQRLIGSLDGEARQLLEEAARRCVARGGQQVLPEDLLGCMLEVTDGLLSRALQDADIERTQLAALLQARGEPGESRNPVFSRSLLQWLQDALLLAGLQTGIARVDQAALLLALLADPQAYVGGACVALLSRIDAQRLREYADSRRPARSVEEGPATGAESALRRFTHDFTEQAASGQLDPVLCRDEEIAQVIDILARRRKNNPIVVGEAGVGKTALVEGLALRIAAGEVPEALRGVRLLGLDLGQLQAGASIKGEFERRLQGVLEEVRSSARPIVLFIDEAHSLIGAGGQAGGSDAANLLKPALARGALRCIAATTWSEYRRYFEKDPALARRFQPVQVAEPSVGQAVSILRGLAERYARSHGVYLRDDAVCAAAELSARYLSGRQLPDKAVDLLDTACARVRIGLASPPPVLQRLRAQHAELQRECAALRRDLEAGALSDGSTLDAGETRLAALEAEHEVCERRWMQQRELAMQVLQLRDEAPPGEPPSAALLAAQEALASAQAEQRLVSHEVCPRLIAEVVSQWTGIPLSQLAREHSLRIADFPQAIRQRIRGQDAALQVLERTLRASAAGLLRSDAPVGVFLLAGPSGVGKTETARALAELLYGGERFLTVINMSEFQERHSLSRLIGAPPGYVGYGEGGMLTEAVRQRPYQVVLLDEVEKADPQVLGLFYQIFDKGLANDGEGREIDFRNTLILLTSNLGDAIIEALCSSGEPSAEALETAIRPALLGHFKPALLARLRVLPYRPLLGEALDELVRLKLQRFAERLAQRQVAFTYDDELVAHLRQACQQGEGGARQLDRLIDEQLQPPLVDRLLAAMAGGEPVRQLRARLDASGSVHCDFA